MGQALGNQVEIKPRPVSIQKPRLKRGFKFQPRRGHADYYADSLQDVKNQKKLKRNIYNINYGI